MTSMTWMAGLMTGPLLAEFVVETFGYFELQCCLGKLSANLKDMFTHSTRGHFVCSRLHCSGFLGFSVKCFRAGKSISRLIRDIEFVISPG